MKTAGLILDMYDDVTGETLRSIFPTPQEIPECVKTAQVVTEQNHVPDELFALVMENEGQVLRKFACVDQGNTVLSTLYFLETGHKLPAEAQKISASNLKIACSWYGLDVPDAIEDIATKNVILVKEGGVLGAVKDLGGAAIKTVGQVATTPVKNVAAVGKAIASPTGFALGVADRVAKNPLGSYMRYSKLKGTASAMKRGLNDVVSGEAAGGVEGGLLAAGRQKVAELSGTDLMPYSKPTPKPSPDDALKKAAEDEEFFRSCGFPERKLVSEDVVKIGSHRMEPYVDTTQMEPPSVHHKKTATFYAMPFIGRYPLDTYDQVKVAAQYFETYMKHFAPEDRREFCTNLLSRAETLGIPVSHSVEKYASETYAPQEELIEAIQARLNVLPEEQQQSLLKIALLTEHQPPETFAQVLAEFDKTAGIHTLYDKHIPDYFYSVFGKEAKDNGEWSELVGAQLVREEDLVSIVRRQFKTISDTFGEDFAKSFRKNPIETFQSLPLPEKTILANLAKDNTPSASR